VVTASLMLFVPPSSPDPVLAVATMFCSSIAAHPATPAIGSLPNVAVSHRSTGRSSPCPVLCRQYVAIQIRPSVRPRLFPQSLGKLTRRFPLPSAVVFNPSAVNASSTFTRGSRCQVCRQSECGQVRLRVSALKDTTVFSALSVRTR
jgi:hypothetical protein